MPANILSAGRKLSEKFNFTVEFASRAGASKGMHFSKCSEVSMEIAKIDYYEGGALIPIKWPGRATMADVTLERGYGGYETLHNWLMSVIDPALANSKGAGDEPENFGDTVTISEKTRDKTDYRRKIQLYGAWPTKYIAGDWDNGVDEVVIEQLTLAYDRFVIDSKTPPQTGKASDRQVKR